MTHRKGNTLLTNWKVDTKTSLSDHKMITFDIDLGNKWERSVASRNYRDMDSSAFKNALAKKLETRPFKAKIRQCMKSNIDSSVNFIDKILTEAVNRLLSGGRCVTHWPQVKGNQRS